MKKLVRKPTVAVIGGGYLGLSASWYLAKNGFDVSLYEAESEIGGLARTLTLSDGNVIERFYHHWFISDTHILDWINELGGRDNICWNESTVEVFYANRLFRLGNPIELLKFEALSFKGRIRLGLLAIYVRFIRDWRKLEFMSARDWLLSVCGAEVYHIIWEPLLRGKFGADADTVSAVWMWNKLKLRGGTRDRLGREMLGYYSGGFHKLTKLISDSLCDVGVKVHLNTKVDSVLISDSDVSISAGKKQKNFDYCLSTLPPSLNLEILEGNIESTFQEACEQSRYIGNRCVILELNCKLSSTYWTNVNDPNFPFVAIIDHANFDKRTKFEARSVLYLSKYLPSTDPLFSVPEDEYVDFCKLALKRVYPNFSDDMVIRSRAYSEKYSQPVVTKHYSKLKAALDATQANRFFARSMANIYPEDRGTNYAVKQGKELANRMFNENLSPR